MATGSEAQNRTLNDWLNSIESGRLRLPSFQRGTAWDPKRVQSMLTTIIHDLPLGVALILNVGEEEKFVSRALHTAPETSEAVAEHLLDGQQRLTALYRALRDNNEKVTYFLHFPQLDGVSNSDDDQEPSIRVVRRRTNQKGIRFPRWADSPRECLQRGLVPIRLLDPTRDSSEEWVDAATEHLRPGNEVDNIAEYREMHDHATRTRDYLKSLISKKRETVRYFNLPYLRLPASTSKETALSVFVNMNTNARPLSAYDIVVAELEGATGQRLKESSADLVDELPRLKHYLSVDNAVLQTSALLQGKLPNQRGYFEMDYVQFTRNWERMARGLRRALQTLELMRIFDKERLPTAIPVPVIAALLADQPEHGDERAVVDRVVRKYVWRSFFTNRYEAAAPTRAAADFKALDSLLDGGEASVPVFDDEVYPLPSPRDMKEARWPKSRRSLPRAILAASNYFGAHDFADDTLISAENIVRREYHHIFPDQLLKEAGIDGGLALNCVLITWKTNRSIGRRDPIAYLEKRVEAAPDPRDVRDRLESHLVPYATLATAGPYDQPAGEPLRMAVQPDFDAFLEERANLIHRFMLEACEGKRPQLHSLLETEGAGGSGNDTDGAHTGRSGALA